ncbi:penicillin-binding protein 1A [Bacillota bacterium LX-D]|nr:penicillin-binding protein 1A [Bacillota bacterium LX-D]
MTAQKKVTRKLNVGRLAIFILLLLFIVGFGATAGFMVGVIKNMPKWKPGEITGDMTTSFYDSEGTLVAERHGLENRILVDYNKIPQNLKNAFIATEDPNFMKHHGISFRSLARALYANIRYGYGAQGGSTITQQLAKNAFIDEKYRYKKSLQRKVQEAILAIQLERTYSKDQIFEFYLNQIPFGRGAYGVQTAAKTFFGKDVEELDLAECALIAGLTQRPAAYDPYRHPEAAKGRRARVLANMVKHGYITQSKADEANKEEFNLAANVDTSPKTKYGYFIDHAIEEAERVLEDNQVSSVEIYKGGYKVYTTLDQTVQSKIEEVFSNPRNFPSDIGGVPVQGAMVIIDPHTGEIKGLVGGRNYKTERGLNRATQMKRSPGSTIKPIAVYGPALEEGYSPASVIDDSPVVFAGNPPYRPTNYDGRYRGLISMREALRYSVNVPAVKMLDTIGINTGYNFALKSGLPLVPSDKNLSLALGGLTYGVSPLDLASAYCAFDNQGVRIEPYVITKIEDHHGNILYEAHPKAVEVMSEQSSYLMTSMLETVVTSGTGTRARMNRPVAGKTGTTQLPDRPEFYGKTGNQDAWFAGYTPELVGVVWMGFDKTDKDHYLYKIYGGQYPAQIWRQVMESVLNNKPVQTFYMPRGLAYVDIDKKSGFLPSQLTPPAFIGKEIFAQKNIPKTVSDIWQEDQVCADSGLLASPNCPNIISGIFMRRPIPISKGKLPEDSNLEEPKTICPIHRAYTNSVNSPEAGQINSKNATKATNQGSNSPEAPFLYAEKEKAGIRLYWRSNNRLQSSITYSIERWSDKNNKHQTIKITDNQTYLDRLIKPGQIYHYRVFAINTKNNLRTFSNEVRVHMK